MNSQAGDGYAAGYAHGYTHGYCIHPLYPHAPRAKVLARLVFFAVARAHSGRDWGIFGCLICFPAGAGVPAGGECPTDGLVMLRLCLAPAAPRGVVRSFESVVMPATAIDVPRR